MDKKWSEKELSTLEMKLETLTVKVSNLYELVADKIFKLIVLLVELIVSLEALKNAWIGLLT